MDHTTVFDYAQIGPVVGRALSKIFHERGKEPKEYYKQYLKELKSEHDTYMDQDVAYFGEVPQKDELAGPEYDNMVFGKIREVRAKEFAKGFRMSKKAMIAIAKKPHGDFSSTNLVSMGTLTKRLKDSARHTKERMAVQVLLTPNVVTPSSKWVGAGRYGEALAGTHTTLKTGEAWINSLTPETLSPNSINDMITANVTAPSPEGFVRDTGSKYTLLYGPALASRVFEVLNTKQTVDSNWNNENTLNPFSFKPVMIPYAGATSTAYALIDDEHGLYFLAPYGPEFNDSSDPETLGWKFTMYFQFQVDFLSNYGFFWNAGVA